MTNFCKNGVTPFQRIKKTFMLSVIIIIIVVIVYYIISPAFNMINGEKIISKKKNNSWIIVLIILFIFIIILFKVTRYYFYTQTIIIGRQDRCITNFTASQGYAANAKQIPTTYHNPYYQKSLMLLMRDMYILGADHATFPCSTNGDLSNNASLVEILRRNTRWIEFDLRWVAQTPLDQDAEPVLATGEPGFHEPKTLPQISKWLEKYSGGFFKRDQQVRLVKLRESLEICSKEGFRNTDAPLFIVLNSASLLDNELLPDYFLESRIATIWAQTFYNRLPLPGYRGLRTSLAEVPVHASFGKVFLIINWKPQDDKLIELVTDRIMPPTISYPEKGIQNIILDQSDINYGGLRSKFVNSNEMIEYNKLHITRVSYKHPTRIRISDLISSEPNLSNVNLLDAKEFGITVWPQNFGDFPGKDDCFKKSLEFFKDGCIKVKPIEMRYVPRPAPFIQEQIPEINYSQRFMSDQTRPGWADFSY